MTRRPVIYEPETRTYRVPLTRGYAATVDSIDADLAALTWTALPSPNTVYACRGIPLDNGKQTTIKLHRVILALKLGRDLSEGEQVDHIDGDGLNNTRDNLRLATSAQNSANRGKQSNNTSGFKGVSWNKPRGKWRAQIRVGGNQIHLGMFTSKDEAHAAYCEAAEEYFGEFANDGNATP